jgi:hypothetical protein
MKWSIFEMSLESERFSHKENAYRTSPAQKGIFNTDLKTANGQ